MTVAMQIILFFALAAEGALTRLAYMPLGRLKKRTQSAAFRVIIDVAVALLGAAVMYLTCFLLAGDVRVFYAVFFLGGLTIAHFLLPKKQPDAAETKE